MQKKSNNKFLFKMTKNLLIPIEIKSEKDLPEEEGRYLAKIKEYNTECIVEYNSHSITPWIHSIEYWYKEVSEEEYRKQVIKENYQK